MFRPADNVTQAPEFGEDGFSGIGPFKKMRMLIPRAVVIDDHVHVQIPGLFLFDVMQKNHAFHVPKLISNTGCVRSRACT